MNKVTAYEFYLTLLHDSIEATEYNVSKFGQGSDWLRGAIVWLQVAKLNLREATRLARKGGAP